MRCCINQIAAHRSDEATPKDSFYCFNFLTQRDAIVSFMQTLSDGYVPGKQ
jgi:hypothetical protein